MCLSSIYCWSKYQWRLQRFSWEFNGNLYHTVTQWAVFIILDSQWGTFYKIFTCIIIGFILHKPFSECAQMHHRNPIIWHICLTKISKVWCNLMSSLWSLGWVAFLAHDELILWDQSETCVAKLCPKNKRFYNITLRFCLQGFLPLPLLNKVKGTHCPMLKT